MLSKQYIAQHKKNTLLGGVIILLGVIATFYLAWKIHSSSKLEDQLKFNYEVDQIMKSISNRLLQYEIVLDQTRALFLSSREVTKQEFQSFVKNSEIIQKYPGFKGVGYALLIPHQKLEMTLRNIKAIHPDFQIFPKNVNDFYVPIYFFEMISAPIFLRLGLICFQKQSEGKV